MQHIIYITCSKSTPHKPKTWSFRGSTSFSTNDFWELLGNSINKLSKLIPFFVENELSTVISPVQTQHWRHYNSENFMVPLKASPI